MRPCVPDRFVHLDMLRGLAALAVVIGHVRGFVLVRYDMVAESSLAAAGLYALAGFGHQAVMAFFALSGYLVGAQVLRQLLCQTWSLKTYLVARLARLWTVAVPALALTLLVDNLGAKLGGAAGYAGNYYDVVASGPSLGSPADHSLSAFLGNVAFMQTIAVPVFGSNGPLWSLANEFWYYIVFPLAAASLLMRGSFPTRVALGVISVSLTLTLPSELMALGAIWVAGAGAGYASRSGSGRVAVSRPYLAVVIGALVATILFDRVRGTTITSLALGLSWAALLPSLSQIRSPGRIYERVSKVLSEISYTLYATHFPLLAFVWFVFFAPIKLQPGHQSIVLACFMFVACLGAAAVLWWCFERNTRRVRTLMNKLVF